MNPDNILKKYFTCLISRKWYYAPENCTFVSIRLENYYLTNIVFAHIYYPGKKVDHSLIIIGTSKNLQTISYTFCCILSWV